MAGGRFGRIRRTLASTLVALFTLGAPGVLDAAFAAPAETKASPAPAKTKKRAASSTKKAKSAAPSPKEAHAVKPAKHTAEAAASAKDTKTAAATTTATTAATKPRPTSASSDGQSAGGRKSKKVASRMPEAKKKTAKKGAPATPPKPCFAAPVSLDRGGLEGEAFSLVDCKGTPLESAREKLSVLARPWGTARPKLLLARKDKPQVSPKKKPGKAEVAIAVEEPVEIAPSIRLLDAGLLARIEAIAKRFPGKGLSLVSGYRPQSRGSLHQRARALDLRVNGVANEELVAFCKTLPDTGCGYYPNSSFVHVDVRNPGTGSVNWIDASGPGESPRYVAQWPPPPEATLPEATLPELPSTPTVVPPANDIDDETPRGGHTAAHGELRSEEPKEPKEPAVKEPAAKEPASDKPVAPTKEPAAKEPAADKPAAPTKEPAAVKPG